MKRIVLLLILVLVVAAPGLVLAQTENHVEFGPFADYFRLDSSNVTNFVGVGGRVGFYLNPYASVEAEMAYDFARNNSFTTSNGVTTSFSTTSVRPLTGLFGPKFQFGKGRFDVFATGKVGFENFSTTSRNAVGFSSSVGSVTTGDTRFALYPGMGVEGFWGHFGLRADVGDQIYFRNGAQHNLRVTFGPQFRF
jgi:hypothetical protein